MLPSYEALEVFEVFEDDGIEELTAMECELLDELWAQAHVELGGEA